MNIPSTSPLTASSSSQATAWTRVTYKRQSRRGYHPQKNSQSRSPTPIPTYQVPSKDADLIFRRLLVGIESNPGPKSPLKAAAGAAMVASAAQQIVNTVKSAVSSSKQPAKKKKKQKKKVKGSNEAGLIRSNMISRVGAGASAPLTYGYSFSSLPGGSSSVSKVTVRNVGVRLQAINAIAPGNFGAFRFSDGINVNDAGLDMNPSAGGGFKPATFGLTIADMAALFSLWRITNLKCRFVPLYGTQTNVTMFLCCTPDPFDTAPANEFAVTAATPNFSFPAWQETELVIPPTVFRGALDWYFCTIGTNNAEGIRQFAPCSVQGGMINAQAGSISAGATMGYLFFDADLEFKTLTRTVSLGNATYNRTLLGAPKNISGCTRLAPEPDPNDPLIVLEPPVVQTEPVQPSTPCGLCRQDCQGMCSAWEIPDSNPVLEKSCSSQVTDLTRKAMLEKQLALIREKLAAIGN